MMMSSNSAIPVSKCVFPYGLAPASVTLRDSEGCYWLLASNPVKWKIDRLLLSWAQLLSCSFGVRSYACSVQIHKVATFSEICGSWGQWWTGVKVSLCSCSERRCMHNPYFIDEWTCSRKGRQYDFKSVTQVQHFHLWVYLKDKTWYLGKSKHKHCLGADALSSAETSFACF